jgi:hypothetical protein
LALSYPAWDENRLSVDSVRVHLRVRGPSLTSNLLITNALP